MKTFLLPPDLFEAASDLEDPLRRYAALSVLWNFNPLDVSCRDLLTVGSKNALPVPSAEEWKIVIEHQHRWEDAIEEASK